MVSSQIRFQKAGNHVVHSYIHIIIQIWETFEIMYEILRGQSQISEGPSPAGRDYPRCSTSCLAGSEACRWEHGRDTRHKNADVTNINLQPIIWTYLFTSNNILYNIHTQAQLSGEKNNKMNRWSPKTWGAEKRSSWRAYTVFFRLSEDTAASCPKEKSFGSLGVAECGQAPAINLRFGGGSKKEPVNVVILGMV